MPSYSLEKKQFNQIISWEHDTFQIMVGRRRFKKNIMVRKYHACGRLYGQYLFKIFTVPPFRPISHRPLLLEDIYDPVNISLGCETCFGQRNMSRSDLHYFRTEELLPCSVITLTLGKGTLSQIRDSSSVGITMELHGVEEN